MHKQATACSARYSPQLASRFIEAYVKHNNRTVKSEGLSMRKMLKAVKPTVVPLIWLINMDICGTILN